MGRRGEEKEKGESVLLTRRSALMKTIKTQASSRENELVASCKDQVWFRVSMTIGIR